jgi:hypothetical protein
MSPPELFGDIALDLLADLQRQQRQGDPMPNPDAVLAAARAHHAAVCRGYNPEATDEQIAKFWDLLGPSGREGYLRTAERNLTEEAAR